jgi:periplasmic protein TonB
MQMERKAMLTANRRDGISQRSTAGVLGQQPRQLVIALLLLLIALGVVIAKNRDFWFGTDLADSDTAAPPTVSRASSAVRPAQPVPAPAAPVAASKNSIAKITAAHKSTSQTSLAPTSNGVSEPAAPAVATTRTVLPPLEIEVIAGDAHHTVRSGSTVKKVEILAGSDRGASKEVASTNAAQHERLQGAGAPEIQQTMDANYPLLGHHTSVQGSVVLQALVGTDGLIQDLRVLSGPAILSAAAQQAVRQWRFKPYLQNGQAVETKAKITVNFSIKISDSPSKTSQGL